MSIQFIQKINHDVLETAIIFLVFLVGYLITLFLLRKKTHDTRNKHQYRVRILYVAAILFLFAIAHIWVEGFSRILTGLGLVSAGILIANKETVMNLTGFFVINWRALFAENDLVKIHDVQGYVRHIGPLYLTIHEVVNNKLTGNTVRIPNGWVIAYSTTNYYIPSKLSLHHLDILVSLNSNLAIAKQLLLDIATDYLQEIYKTGADFSHSTFKGRKNKFNRLISLKPDVALLTAKQAEFADAITIRINFYALIEDTTKAKTIILERFLAQAQTNNDIQFIHS